ncbi:MAG: PspC domain-containing protein [bacterium]
MVEKKKAEPKPTKSTPPEQEAPRRLYRSLENRMIAGVCGGFAEYFKIDPTVMRVLWVIAGFLNGFGILAYIVSWLVVSDNPQQAKTGADSRSQPQNAGLIWGVVLIALGLFFLAGRLDLMDNFGYDWVWRPMWFGFFRFDVWLPIAIIAIGVVYLLSVAKKDKQAEDAKAGKTSGGAKVEKKLTRSVDDKMIGGVCGGLAKYFNVDPAIVRIAYALLTVFSSIFPGVIAYIVMLIVVPEETSATPTSTASKATPAKAKGK